MKTPKILKLIVQYEFDKFDQFLLLGVLNSHCEEYCKLFSICMNSNKQFKFLSFFFFLIYSTRLRLFKGFIFEKKVHVLPFFFHPFLSEKRSSVRVDSSVDQSEVQSWRRPSLKNKTLQEERSQSSHFVLLFLSLSLCSKCVVGL